MSLCENKIKFYLERELQNSIWGQMPCGRTILSVASKGLRINTLLVLPIIVPCGRTILSVASKGLRINTLLVLPIIVPLLASDLDFLQIAYGQQDMSICKKPNRHQNHQIWPPKRVLQPGRFH